jgi:D-amino peptidase
MKKPRFARPCTVAGLLAAAGLLLAGSAHAFKVYIFTDMEGCSGITCSEQISGPRAEEGKRLMAEDMNACIAGCFAAGATEVVVRDGHSSGSNVNARIIDSRARLIQGSTPGVRNKDLDGAAAVILLGYHAMALTTNGVLAHSYSSASIQGMWLNGRPVGEIGVDMAIAAEHGIPVVLVTGDEQTVAEAKAWLPEVNVCATKRGTSHQSADLVPLEKSHQQIQQATATALRRRTEIPCLKISYPATLRWDYLPKGSLRTHHPDFKPVPNPRRVEKTGSSVEKLLLGK